VPVIKRATIAPSGGAPALNDGGSRRCPILAHRRDQTGYRGPANLRYQ